MLIMYDLSHMYMYIYEYQNKVLCFNTKLVFFLYSKLGAFNTCTLLFRLSQGSVLMAVL